MSAGTDAQLDADRMVYMLQLRDQRNALCAIARAFGWGSEDWTVERLVAEAARLTTENRRLRLLAEHLLAGGDPGEMRIEIPNGTDAMALRERLKHLQRCAACAEHLPTGPGGLCGRCFALTHCSRCGRKTSDLEPRGDGTEHVCPKCSEVKP